MKNPGLVISFLLSLGLTTGFAQTPTRAKCLEKIKPLVPKTASSSLAAKTTTISKPLRSANYAWNVNLSQWLFADSSAYSYTPVGWLASELKKTSAPTTRTTYAYDGQNRMTNKFTETWNATTSLWMNTNRQTVVYDAQGNLTQNTYEIFNGTIWVIQNAAQYIYTYDANNHLIDYISQYWNTANQVWNDYHHQMGFLYDANGNCTQYEEQVMINSNWVNMDRFMYTYVNNVPVDVLTQHWNGTAYVNDEWMVNITWHSWNGVFSNLTAVTSCTIQDWANNTWYPDVRVNVTYDNFGGSVEVDQSYNGSNWNNTYRYKTNFDNQYNYTGNSLELWNSPVWDLYSEDKIINTYDADFNFTQQIWQYWDDFGSQMVNIEKRVYEGYEVFAGLNEQKSSARISVFPNPCADYFEIGFDKNTLLKSEDVQVLLYDLNGKMIKQATLSLSGTRIGIEDLSPGLYMYDLRTGSESIKKGKLLVQ